MNQSLLSLSLLSGLFIFPPVLDAATPLGGLDVAVSPDGATVAAAGDNRTLYLLEAGSMEVKKRIWLGTTVIGLDFNKDGSVIAVECTQGKMTLFQSADGAKKSEHEKMSKLSFARDVDLVAGLNPDYKGHVIRFASLSDGSEKGTITFPKEIKIASFGLSAAGDKLAVMSNPIDDSEEPKVSYKDMPKDLKGLDRDVFQMKNDGKVSMFSFYEVPSGKKISEHKIFYTSSNGTRILFSGDNAVVVNYSNDNATVTPGGKVEMFELKNSFNYGLGIASDQSVILSGGLRKASVTKTTGMEGAPFEIGQLPGWPEYFKGFAANADGPCYGSTTAFRVIQFDRSGKVLKEVPCY